MTPTEPQLPCLRYGLNCNLYQTFLFVSAKCDGKLKPKMQLGYSVYLIENVLAAMRNVVFSVSHPFHATLEIRLDISALSCIFVLNVVLVTC